MQKVLNACVPWLNWKVTAVFGIVLVGIVLYAERSSWSLWVGATPPLAIAAIVVQYSQIKDSEEQAQ